MQQHRIDEICRGERAVTGDTALRLARLFGVDAAFGINLQGQYDLEIAYRKMQKVVEKEVTPLEKLAA